MRKEKREAVCRRVFEELTSRRTLERVSPWRVRDSAWCGAARSALPKESSEVSETSELDRERRARPRSRRR